MKVRARYVTSGRELSDKTLDAIDHLEGVRFKEKT
jgi:hypothetical protein